MYFKLETLATLSGNLATLKNQLVQWQKEGKVHQLRRGIYTLNDSQRRLPLPRFLIANILYPPSYISLEAALSFFGLIPERVTQIASVTTRKTAHFKNVYGSFYFHNMKASRFFGFDTITQPEGFPILMARPEKAILDKIYFDTAFKAEAGYFLDSLRLQHFETLNVRHLEQYAKRFHSKKIKQGASVLRSLIQKERNERHS